MTAFEEQLAKYEREVEMLLQKRVARLTAEEPQVKGEQETLVCCRVSNHYQCCHADAEEEDQLAPLKEFISEKLEEIQKSVTSNEEVCLCVCVVCVCVLFVCM